MARKNQAGCGCCCVNLVVDDDNTGSWSRTDDAINDISTITINRAVPLCNFQFGFAASHPNSSGGTVAIDGTMTVYFLSNASDANVDAIGYITCNIVSPSSTVTRFWDDNPFGASTATIQVLGTGEIHIPAMGISNKTFYIDSFYSSFGGLSLAIYNNKLIMSASYSTSGDQLNTFYDGSSGGLRIFTGTSAATCDAIGFPFVQNGTTCTDQDVYIRYVVEGDINSSATQFALNELNVYSGERSCRTDTSYYSVGSETGNCLSIPDEGCLLLPSEKAPFVVLNVDLPNISVNKTQIPYVLPWTAISNPGKCVASVRLDGDAALSTTWEILSSSRLTFSCSSGTVQIVAFISILYLGATQYDHEWTVTLPLSVEDYTDIPTTTLDESNATTFESPSAFGWNFTINP